jgi:hypothetical protein
MTCIKAICLTHVSELYCRLANQFATTHYKEKSYAPENFATQCDI